MELWNLQGCGICTTAIANKWQYWELDKTEAKATKLAKSHFTLSHSQMIENIIVEVWQVFANQRNDWTP